MENKAAAKKKSSLRHRFAQILLGSSCTTTTTTTNYSGIKLVNLTSPAPPPQEPPEVHSDCGIDKPQQKQRRRRKLDRSADCFAPRVPVVQVSIDCGARHSIHSYEPFLPSTPKVEKNDKLKEKKPTALYEALRKEQKRLPPSLLSACSRNISSSYSHRGEVANNNKKKISNQNKDKAKRKETMRLLSNAYGFSSSSSCDSGTEHGLYSSDEEDEDEEESAGTLFSSRSFSSDSSEFYRSKKKNNKKTKKSRSASMKCTRRPARPLNTRRVTRPHKDDSDATDKFRPLVSYSSSTQKAETKPVAESEVGAAAAAETEAEKAKAAEGFAVVKSSSDPYMDFRSSMVEMIVERRIRSAKDLEGLLRSYLSLNSAHHHPAIVEAFKDIWEAIFCCLD